MDIYDLRMPTETELREIERTANRLRAEAMAGYARDLRAAVSAGLRRIAAALHPTARA